MVAAMPGAVVNAQPFLVGKLPAHGDFVSRGLSLPVIRAWDAWCGIGLERAQDALGADFEDRLRGARRWRFCLAAGLLDERWHVGTIQPTRDRIGRPFLLVAGAHLAEPPGADAAEHVAATAETCARSAIEDGWDADRLLAVLDEIGSGGTDEAPPPSRLWTGDGSAVAHSLSIATLDPALISTMLDVRETD